jgi:hypothetical protein
MWMRLRLPELLAAQDPPLTAHALAKNSSGRISPSTAFRIVGMEGRLKLFDARLCETLCDMLGVTPGELFETDAEEAARVAADRPARKRAK